MGNRTDRIFEAFREVNDIELVPVFGEGAKYSGLDYDRLSKEELMEKIDFAGFVDGIEGNPSKHLDRRQEIRISFEESVERAKKKVGKKGTETLRSLSERAGELAEILSRHATGMPHDRYAKQYKLGSASRDRI